MRHRKRGRRLGRSSPHKKALLRNLTSALILTEREVMEWEENGPKVQGRIITTLAKAKEVRSYVERCISIACRSLEHTEKAETLASTAERGSPEWKQWRQSPQWREWAVAIAPAVNARRRALRMLGDKKAVAILFETLAPRFADRKGGYTRILKLASPRLGDAGKRAILEFVGVRDRVTSRAERPAFEDESAEQPEEKGG